MKKPSQPPRPWSRSALRWGGWAAAILVGGLMVGYFTAGALALLLAQAALRSVQPVSLPKLTLRQVAAAWWLTLTGVALVLIAAAPAGIAPLPEGPLRLASYNMHYGYDGGWRFTLEQQAEALRAEGVEQVRALLKEGAR